MPRGLSSIQEQVHMLIQKLNCYWLFAVLICASSFECRAKEDVWRHTEYVHPIDGATVPCPFVSLQGIVLQHTFPGVPNYESIEDGDAPETRWVLVIPESEIQRLSAAGFIPKEDIFTSEARGWVQLIAPDSESDPIPFLQKQVLVEGYLGTLISHIHTPIAIESVSIYFQ